VTATIRGMLPGDYDEVVALWQATEGVGLGDADSRENVEAYLAQNEGMSFVGVEGDRIVAAALCGADGRRGYLHHLAVAPACRGQGLGRDLAEQCLAALADQGIGRCHIHVFARNIEARNFWLATGWRHREELVVLSKDL